MARQAVAGGEVAKVVAVTYDFTQEGGTDTEYGEPHVTIDGRLHKGRIPPG